MNVSCQRRREAAFWRPTYVETHRAGRRPHTAVWRVGLPGALQAVSHNKSVGLPSCVPNWWVMMT